MEIPIGFTAHGVDIDKVTGSLPKEQLDRMGQSLVVSIK
jgi:hypothetical protein